jgi:hypothetical protein
MATPSVPVPEASGLLTAGFFLFGLAMAVLFVAGVAWAERRLGAASARVRRCATVAAAGALGWLGGTWALAASGLLARFDLRPPPFLVFLVVLLGVTVALAASPLGSRLVAGLPLAALVGAQSFRLPLEVLMHRAATEGVMPVQMSYAGYNLDIVTGASAAVVGIVLGRGLVPRWTAGAWNIGGTLLLANVLSIAAVSTPVLGWFGPDRLNTWVAFPPFVWLPGAMVVMALLGHLLVWRKLRALSRAAEG